MFAISSNKKHIKYFHTTLKPDIMMSQAGVILVVNILIHCQTSEVSKTSDVSNQINAIIK